MEPFEEVKIILSSSQERRRGEPGLKVGEDDKDGHSLDFFLFLPAQLRLRELIGEEVKLQEIDALAQCLSNGHDGLLQAGSAGKCSPSCDPHHHQGRFWQALGTPCSHHEEACLGSPHFLKLFLLSDQFPQSQLSWQKKEKVETMAIFIIFPYLQSWFTSPSLLGAAQNDLDLFKRLQKFSKIDKKISSAASSVLSRHPWYLTEELIPVSLFNISLPVEERTLLAKKIGSLPPANLKVCKPHLPQATVDSCLLDFVGPRSVLLFNLLGTSHTFLLEDDWMEQPDYFTTAAALENLTPERFL